jgi:hypothetical protein
MADTNGKMFLYCGKCGKKLIERKPNGLFYFVFGKKKDGDGNLLDFSPVEIIIHGSVKIKCISKICNHWNTFTYFPQLEEQQQLL